MSTRKETQEKDGSNSRWRATDQLRHHYPGLCHACAAAPTQQRPLQRCAQCHLVMYCSKGCQRNDWPTHRSFCLAHKAVGGHGVLETAATAAAAVGHQQGNKATMKQQQLEFLGSQRVVASLVLGRQLWPHEAEALVHPRLCEVCSSVGEPGVCCGVCHCVYYCDEQHRAADRAKHGRWCGLYRLCVLCDQWLATTSTAIALPAAVDAEYHSLPSSMMAHLAVVLGQDRTEDPTIAALLSEQLTFPLTALYVLQHTCPGLAKAQQLTLHLVGAEEGHEPALAAVWEYLLHRLPCLTHLHIVMIGPQFTALGGRHEALLCQACQEDGRRLILEGQQCLYHQYIAEAAPDPPDMCVAFNCGFHEWAGDRDDTWLPSVALMVASDIPLTFTSYTHQEAERDLLAVHAAAGPGIRVVMASPNPYHSLRPLRDWAREDGQQLYHNNQFLTVVQGGQPAIAATTT